MALDAATAEVVTIFDRLEIPCMLLKGPAMAARLYADDVSQRSYTDIDLLVPTHVFGAARDALSANGYARALPSGPTPRMGSALYEEAWLQVANPVVVVDLHRGFHGVGRQERFWEILHNDCRSLRVGGADAAVPNEPGCALLAALHVWPGDSARRPMADLDRALGSFDDIVWREASEMAGECDALAAFTVGLGKRPEGAQLVERLGISTSAAPAIWLLSSPTPPRTSALGAWLALPTWRRRLAPLPRIAFPKSAYMRGWARRHPRETSGRPPALAGAYALRLLKGLQALPAAAGHWRASSRVAGESGWAPVHTARRTATVRWVARRCLVAVQGAPLALWVGVAWRRVHRQLPSSGLEGEFSTRTPPPSRALSDAQGDRVVRAVLRRSGASCLEEALIRQQWLASRGTSRDVVVGVTSPSEGFRAHAWLSGDAVAPDYVELFHKPPSGGVQTVGR
jgi:hypothetical protein